MMVIKCECLPRTTWAVISRCLILTEIQRGRCWRTCAVQRRPGRIQLWGSWLRRPGLCLLSISRCANPCPTLGMFFRGFNVVSCTVVWLVISIGHWSRSKWFLYFRPGYLRQGGGYAIGAVCLWATITWCYDWGYQSEELVIFGGDSLLDTDCGSLFHFPHHCGIEDFSRFIRISDTVTGRF